MKRRSLALALAAACCSLRSLASCRRPLALPTRRPMPGQAAVRRRARHHQGRQGDPGRRHRQDHALVDSKIMPNVNFQRMTASAVGPAWRQATPEQQKRLQEEFKMLLVRTYSGALRRSATRPSACKPLRGSPDRQRCGGAHRGPRPRRSDPARLPAGKDAGPGRRLEDLQPERAGRLAGGYLPQPVRAGDQRQGHRRPDRRRWPSATRATTG